MGFGAYKGSKFRLQVSAFVVQSFGFPKVRAERHAERLAVFFWGVYRA